MTIIKDPEQNETAVLFSMIDFTNKSVLEIGVGDGRFTWRFADRAAHVTALDPNEEILEATRANMPESLNDRVTLLDSTVEDFAEKFTGRKFDVAIFSWSL